jgi:hypothetical protein
MGHGIRVLAQAVCDLRRQAGLECGGSGAGDGLSISDQPMIARSALWPAPGESLETTVLFSVQEGLTSVGGVAVDGTILPGDEE